MVFIDETWFTRQIFTAQHECCAKMSSGRARGARTWRLPLRSRRRVSTERATRPRSRQLVCRMPVIRRPVLIMEIQFAPKV